MNHGEYETITTIHKYTHTDLCCPHSEWSASVEIACRYDLMMMTMLLPAEFNCV